MADLGGEAVEFGGGEGGGLVVVGFEVVVAEAFVAELLVGGELLDVDDDVADA